MAYTVASSIGKRANDGHAAGHWLLCTLLQSSRKIQLYRVLPRIKSCFFCASVSAMQVTTIDKLN